jgi:hypothetical protein
MTGNAGPAKDVAAGRNDRRLEGAVAKRAGPATAGVLLGHEKRMDGGCGVIAFESCEGDGKCGFKKKMTRREEIDWMEKRIAGSGAGDDKTFLECVIGGISDAAVGGGEQISTRGAGNCGGRQTRNPEARDESDRSNAGKIPRIYGNTAPRRKRIKERPVNHNRI